MFAYTVIIIVLLFISIYMYYLKLSRMFRKRMYIYVGINLFVCLF